MPLSVGDRLGPYEILAPIGAGGMGEVYRACDTTLKRDVALKVLPAAFLRDPERMARFQREAQVLASLDHPNIGHIHGIVDSEDSRGLVLALIEGPTLADRIAAGPLPLDEAIAISKQIVEALEYAHERGIVHRDLKPANIKITSEGVVKVLDFGLAKVLEDEPPVSSLANSPTLTLGHTRAGMILGTAAYMSPEQAVGRPVDRRSDIFSFGAVLYEMLTGKRAFTGATTPDVLEAVVKNDPDWSKLPVETPEFVRRLLRRCLTKDRKQRLQAIGEARITLNTPLNNPLSNPLESPAQTAAATSPSRLARTVPWAAAAVATAAALILGYVAYRYAGAEAPGVVKMLVSPPEKSSYNNNFGPPVLSPDGRHLVFSDNVDGKTSLWVRDLDSVITRPLAGTEDGTFPFWSPDSRFIGFFSQGKLKKIDLAGGPALTICGGVTAGHGATWSKSGVIVFAPATNGGLFRVPSAGGIATPVTVPDAALKEQVHWYPWFLPDGRHFLYTATAEDGSGTIYVADLEAKDAARSRRKVIAANSQAVYSPPGYLLYLREQTLMAQPFDAAKAETTGDAVPVAEQVSHASGAIAGMFSVSPSGALVYRTGGNEKDPSQLTWFDRQGKILSTFGQPGANYRVALSPDGMRAAVRDARGDYTNGDLWILDFARGVRTRITFHSSPGSNGAWSPDGSRIVFAAGNGRDTLYEKASSGAGEEKELLKEPNNILRPFSWSRDGRFLLYLASGSTGKGSQWVLPMEGDHKPVRLLDNANVEASFSPDIHWIAYSSNESGRGEVYVRPFLASGPSGTPSLGEGKWQISRDGGNEPKWRGDGKEIFFQAPPNGESKMAVEVKTNGAAFEPGVPQLLFKAPLDEGWDVTADGKRFLLDAVPDEQQSEATPITLVLNWQAELKK